MKRVLLWIALSGLLLFMGFAVLTFSSIYRDVKGITITAKAGYQGDAVQALIELVKSDNLGFEKKNTAIWAIGQYADPSALPFLEKLNSATPEDSVPFNRSSGLSKREIEKAIKWCREGNWTSWMYKKLK